MSADNGIYISQWKNLDGSLEFRAAHTTAIENCEDSQDYPKRLTDAYRVFTFGNSDVYKTLEDAQKKAWEIYDWIMDSDFPVIEYGICRLTFDEPFPAMTMEEAKANVMNYWENPYEG